MSARLRGLDWLRLHAVGAVVVQHTIAYFPAAATHPTALMYLDGLTTWDIPALFLVSGFLAGWRSEGTARHTRLARLVVPFVCWGFFYAIFSAALRLHAGLTVTAPNLAGILTGQGVYFTLWFLPMLLYCTIISWGFGSWRRCLYAGALSLTGWAILAARLSGATGLFYASSPRGFLYHLPFFAGCVLLAKSLGLGWRSREVALPTFLFVLATPLWVASALLNTLTWGDATVGVYAALIALGAVEAAVLLALAVRFGSKLPSLSPWWWSSTAPLGIYLVHMVFLEALSRLIPPGAWYVWIPVTAVCVFALAAASVALSTRVRILRPAFGLALDDERHDRKPEQQAA